jgi:hypothetical protein
MMVVTEGCGGKAGLVAANVSGLCELLQVIARAAGVAIDRPLDEHERWRVYLAAIDLADCNETMLTAVQLEPDSSVALGVVLRKIERLPEGDRQTWIDALPTPRQREYATRRAQDLAILDARPLAPRLHEGIEDSWSDWLQLRLAEFSCEPEVVSWLRRTGRTKRIRRVAAENVHRQ